MHVYGNHRDLSSISRTYIKFLAIVACACNSGVGEVVANGYLGLAGQLSLANGQALDLASEHVSRKDMNSSSEE